MKDIEYIVQSLAAYNAKQYKLIKKHKLLICETVKNPNNYLDKLSSTDYVSFLFLACILTTDSVFTISPPSEPIAEWFDLKAWLSDIKLLNANGKQSNVFIGKFLGQDVVLKKPKKSYFLENTLKDYFIGIKYVNDMRTECAMFPQTFGLLATDSKLEEVWLVTEHINGQTLKSMLSGQVSFKQFLLIFIQLLIALEMGQEHCRFCHYDLHTDNIIIVDEDKTNTYHLFTYDIVVKHKYKPIIIDFGMSSVFASDTGISIGQHDNSKNGIYPYLVPGYDAYTFLLFVTAIAKPALKNSIKKLDTLIRYNSRRVNTPH